MKWLLALIAAFFIGTYLWGWNVHVRQGGMSADGYTRFYQRQVEEQAASLWEHLTAGLPSQPVKRSKLDLPY